MFETRRQIFRKSIFSAFGLMALPAVTGCTRESEGTGSQTLSDYWEAVTGKATDNRWYIFILKSIDARTLNYTYTVYQSLENPPSNPRAVKFDVNDWFNDLRARNKLVPATKPFTIDSTPYTPDDNGVVVANPLHTDEVQIVARWNEIGKQ